MKLADIKARLKGYAAKTVWAYGPDQLIQKLQDCGIHTGTTLMLHSSWQQYNGFQGKPADLVRAFKLTVGQQGLLVMPSMPYHNMSSAQWLEKGRPMDVRRSPSMMGLVSEVFRRSEGVQRSLSATHPLLAWGEGAQDFISGHEHTDRPFGPLSPFAKLLHRDAIILGFDAPFSTFTLTHFVEDLLADTLPIPLYKLESMRGTVVNADGERSEQNLYVLSDEANRQRREHRLVNQLSRTAVLHKGQIGNTVLTWIRACDLSNGAKRLVAEGGHFFDPPNTLANSGG